MGRGLDKKSFLLVAMVCAISLTAYFALADSDVPFGVRSIDYIQSSRADPLSHPPASMDAAAGNVTEMDLIAIGTTKSWQGYYGNITGVITLEDSNGYVFYNWSAAEPKGEVYASVNGTVNWLNIRCFDWDIGATGQSIDMNSIEDFYGIPDDASDGLNDTYVETDSLDNELFVGSVNITDVSLNTYTAACHSTNTYTYDVMGVESDFENLLLTDGDALVFTTIIENNVFNNETDINGFDGRPHDFQLLVAENGHNGHEDQDTLYYFWAEIE